MPSPDHRTVRDVHTPWPERMAATASPAAERSRERARELRQSMSPPEVLLWQQLRGRRILGLKFRRQHVLGPYFADFYCHELKLVVEVDGYWEHRAEALLWTRPLCCRADFNCIGGVTVQDIFDFLNAYFTNDIRADFSRDGLIGVQDIFDYLAAYFLGCP